MAKIFSIKKKYSDKIFQKEKMVEFRRKNVRADRGEKCLVYTSAPTKKITGYFVIKEKLRLPIENLWKKTKAIAGITKKEFLKYFEGCFEGTAIIFKKIKKFTKEIELNEIRKIYSNFTPPQSYLNLEDRLASRFITKFSD